MTNSITKVVLLIILLAAPLVLAESPSLLAPPADCPEMAQLAEAMYLAQVDDGEQANAFRRARHEYGEGKQRRNHLDQLRVLKMLELLNLNEDQEVAFLTAFNRMRKEQRRLSDEIGQIVDSLGLQLRDDGTKEAALNRSVDQLLALEEDKHRLAREFIGEAKSILNAEQVARLVVFKHRFESELLERVGRFRRGNPDGPGGPPPGHGKN